MQPTVLVITNSYPNRYKPYAGKYVERHVMLHRSDGWRIIVLTPADSRNGFLRDLWKYGKLIPSVLRIALWENFDLVHAHWELPSGLLGTILSRWRGVPLIVTSHGAFTDSFASRSRLVRQLVRLVLRRADRVITVGQYQKRAIESIASLPGNRVLWIPIGVWLEDVPPGKQIARERLGIDSEKKIMVFIGNLLWCKGPDILVRATAQLVNKGGQFELVIGGQGEQLASLRHLVDELRMTSMSGSWAGSRQKMRSFGLLPLIYVWCLHVQKRLAW